MKDLSSIVLLIDADNASVSDLNGILREVSLRGRIVVKRAYGNWSKSELRNWSAPLNQFGFKAVQQFDYTAHKNATDMALTIDAMDLLHKGGYDAFVLVSSDSDFTPLAIYLREAGVSVLGVGKSTTPEAFRNACDEFISLENIPVDKKTEENAPSDGEETGSADAVPPGPALSDAEGEASETDETPDGADPTEELHELLRIAHERYQDDDGYANVAAVGSYIRRVKPDYDIRDYGYTKLPQFLRDFPDRYEVKRYSGKGTVTIVAFRCKESAATPGENNEIR